MDALLREFDLRLHFDRLFGPPPRGPVHLRVQLEVLQALRLFLGGAFELKLGPRLDGLVVHLLEPVGCAVTAVNDLVDPVPALGCPHDELAVGFDLIQLVGVVLERLEVVAAGEIDDV